VARASTRRPFSVPPSWFIGEGRTSAGRSHKCYCPAVRERGGSVHRTHLCLVCQLEVYTPPLNEETCRLGEIESNFCSSEITALAGRVPLAGLGTTGES